MNKVKIVKNLIKRIEAKDKLLGFYRIGKRPSESTLETLDKTKNAVSDAERLLDEWRDK